MTHDMLEQARELLRAGQHEGARMLLLSLAEKGLIAAYVELAKLDQAAGASQGEVARHIDLAEEAVRQNDYEGHFWLHRAYSRLLGSADRDVQMRKAFEHLCAAAEGNNARDLLSVGLHYRFGLNGVEQDLKRAEEWLVRAAATGDEEAISEYSNFLRSAKRS